jgi:hypothetical protein
MPSLTVYVPYIGVDYCGLYHASGANKYISYSVNMRFNLLLNPSPAFYDVQDGGKELKVQNLSNRQCLLSTRNLSKCLSPEVFQRVSKRG